MADHLLLYSEVNVANKLQKHTLNRPPLSFHCQLKLHTEYAYGIMYLHFVRFPTILGRTLQLRFTARLFYCVYKSQLRNQQLRIFMRQLHAV